jgi:DNA-binding CsgD family transcriptional regulator
MSSKRIEGQKARLRKATVAVRAHGTGYPMQPISTAERIEFNRQTIPERWNMEIRSGGVTTMRHPSTQASASEGFLLLDSSLSPVFVNRVAAEILSYPNQLETHKKLDDYLADRVRATLMKGGASRFPTLVSELRSGRRLYQCRSYRVNALAEEDYQGCFAIILERGSKGSFSIARVTERFRLTTREQEVLQYLLNGLTTKQIAVGMEISPNTVKAFLRMIMVKMGVSTRSGIVGKAFTGTM